MPLEWIFDPAPPSRARKGGLANAQVFDPTLDAFVREVLQNSRDQRLDDDSPVGVRFTLSELSGPGLVSFLEAIRWSRLVDHLEATAVPQLVTIGPRLREGLEEVAAGRLRVLRIQDAGTRGLTGDEDSEDNFANLVRHELITSAARRESGGSFGLGKSVLWRFSNLSTVLFHSVESVGARHRFIGRTVLAGHEAHGRRWEGSGWFGRRDPSDPAWAISVWDDEARRAADRTELARTEDATGTSILVVGFDDPSRETELSVADTCEEIARSATRWFWPALVRGDIDVFVDGFDATGQVYAAHAQATNSEVAPFVHAQQGHPTAADTIIESGDIAERELAVRVPAQSASRSSAPAGPVDAKATLRIRLAESGDTQYRNTVALQRGAGMVVQYRGIKTRMGVDQAVQAVLLAGRARGDSPADQALEEFLRAAEPPAHNEWTHTTERVKAEYKTGRKKALDDLFAAIDKAIRELTREEVVDTDEGPDALRKFFPLRAGGPVTRKEKFRLSDVVGKVSDDRWVFSGRFTRSPDASETENWEFVVALAVDQEGSGKPTGVPIMSLDVAAPATVTEIDGSSAVISVPAGTGRVEFRGLSERVAAVPTASVSKTRLRLDVRGRTLFGGTK